MFCMIVCGIVLVCGAVEVLPWPVVAISATLCLVAQFFLGRSRCERTESDAWIDGLTKVFCRSRGQQLLGSEFERGQRYKHPLVVAIVDADKFKGINDRYGHQGGDAVLRFIGRTLKALLRKYDIVVRWGGEEFVIILPETSMEGALVLLERLRKALDTIVCFKGEEIKVSCSFGAACATAHSDLEDLLAAADRQLYLAKNGGRNRVCAELAPVVEAVTA